MRIGFASLLATLVLLSAFAPSTARAQAPIDCSSGCYIITCNAGQCTMWRCDAGGCTFVTTWDRKWVEAQTVTGSAKQANASAPEVAHASICAPGKRCELYELTVAEAVRLGSFDNAADLVRQRQALRGTPVRAR